MAKKKSKKNEDYTRLTREDSILVEFNCNDYLKKDEFFKIYSFYVLHNLINNESFYGKNYKEYGWPFESCEDKLFETTLKLELKSLEFFSNIHASSNKCFVDNLKKYSLLKNINTEEECCVMIHSNSKQKFETFLIRIRNTLCHGNYKIYKNKDKKMVIILEDYNKNILNCRMVIKVETLIEIIKIVDKNKLIK